MASLRSLLESDRARPVRYLLVGVWNTAFGWLVYSAFLFLTDALGSSYLIATIPAQLVAILQAWYTQRNVAFRVTDAGTRWRSFLRFNGVYWGMYLITTPLLALLVSGFGLTPRVASAILTLGSAVVSYVAHLRFTFRQPTPPGR